MSKRVKFIGINNESEFNYFIDWCGLNTDFKWVDGSELDSFNFKALILNRIDYSPPYAFIVDGNDIMFNSYSNILKMNQWRGEFIWLVESQYFGESYRKF